MLLSDLGPRNLDLVAISIPGDRLVNKSMKSINHNKKQMRNYVILLGPSANKADAPLLVAAEVSRQLNCLEGIMTMRNSLRLAVVGALAAASFASSAQAATSATGTATAEVLSTLTVTNTSALQFGQIAANNGGTVSVNANGSASASGSIVSTGTRAPATFAVTGSPNASVIVTLPSGPINLTRSGGSETMAVSAFNTDPSGGFQLDSSGAGNFAVGGTLTIAANQVPGSYSGSFSVSVEYQ